MRAVGLVDPLVPPAHRFWVGRPAFAVMFEHFETDIQKRQRCVPHHRLVRVLSMAASYRSIARFQERSRTPRDVRADGASAPAEMATRVIEIPTETNSFGSLKFSMSMQLPVSDGAPYP